MAAETLISLIAMMGGEAAASSSMPKSSNARRGVDGKALGLKARNSPLLKRKVKKM